jgi:hypothetical protein
MECLVLGPLSLQNGRSDDKIDDKSAKSEDLGKKQ